MMERNKPWWRHQMETFSALLALCAGNTPVTGEFSAQRPVTWSFDVFFVLRLNKRLSKHSWGWWFETPSRSLWRHCNVNQNSDGEGDEISPVIILMVPCRMGWLYDDNASQGRTMGNSYSDDCQHRKINKSQQVMHYIWLKCINFSWGASPELY